MMIQKSDLCIIIIIIINKFLYRCKVITSNSSVVYLKTGVLHFVTVKYSLH